MYIPSDRISCTFQGDECDQLMELLEIGGTQGDGYLGGKNNLSPHTDFEQFVGITIHKAAEVHCFHISGTIIVYL